MYIAFESYLLTILNQKYMFRGSLIFLFMFTLLLGSCGTGLPSTLDDTLSIQGAEDELRETATLPVINLPDEVMIQIFSELSVKDIAHASGVSKHWYSLSEEPALWRAIRLRIHGDYPASDATKEQAKKHILRVYVNSLSDVFSIQNLVHKYKLNEQHPFKIYQGLLTQFNGLRTEMTNGYAAQGNETAISHKIQGFLYGTYGYEKNPKAAIAFNDSLVEQGNKEAIERKINDLANGRYVYDKDPKAAFEFNERLVEQGNEKAIIRKIKGLAYGEYGYEKNPKAAVALNESLIEQGNESAIERKIYGLLDGKYGYEKNPEAAVLLNDSLVEQGNENAIKWKIDGLANGNYGYKKNAEAAVALNEALVEQGNEKAIIRQIEGFTKGKNGYIKDVTQLKRWIEEQSDKGKRWACYLKVQGLKYGILGFEEGWDAAMQYILKNNIPY